MPLGAARFGLSSGASADMEMTIYMTGGGGGGGQGVGQSGWGYFRGAGGGGGGMIEGTAELFDQGTSYNVSIGAGAGGGGTGGDTTIVYKDGTLYAKGGGRGGNGSGNYAGSGGGGSGGSGGGGGTVFQNVRPYDSHGYNGGQDNQDSQTVPSGLTNYSSDGGKGNRGSGFSDGNPPPGQSGGANGNATYDVNSTGNGPARTVTPLGYSVGGGGQGNAANKGHGGQEGNHQSGGSGFIYILYDSSLSISTSGLTTSTGTYSGQNYVHITSGSGSITFS